MHEPSKNTLSLLGFNPTGDLGPLTAYTSQRSKAVWFPKTNPLSPPSPMQQKMRNLYRLYAAAWRALSPTERNAWSTAARQAALRITGFNLWVWYQRFQDTPTIRTIERISGITLI